MDTLLYFNLFMNVYPDSLFNFNVEESPAFFAKDLQMSLWS